MLVHCVGSMHVALRMTCMTMQQQSIQLTTEADTQTVALALAKAIKQGVVFLEGDLGAGKTTLVRYWLQALGVSGAIKSPTYTLVESYAVLHTTQDLLIYHFDLYRLQDPEELDMLGFQDYISAENTLVLIEWPSKAGYLAPQPACHIQLAHAGQDQRVLTVKSVAAIPDIKV